MPRNRNSKEEKSRKLSIENENDCEFIRKVGDLPQPENKLDYDYMQFTRLLDKKTLWEIEKNDEETI